MTALADRKVLGAAALETAHRHLRHNSWRTADEADLVAELNQRMNDIARWQADLADGVYDDGDADQLRGGIAYEESRIEEIVFELERRERARAFGYRGTRGPNEPDLPARFARIRAAGADDLAGLIGQETGQPGHKAGERWYFHCPFHAGGQERTASLVVYPDGRGHCFSCAWHGDAIDFVAELNGTTLVSALRLLERGLI